MQYLLDSYVEPYLFGFALGLKTASSAAPDPGARSLPEASRIFYHPNACSVLWADGTRTVVRRMPGDAPSPYSAFAAAALVKLFGSNSAAKKYISRHTEPPKKDKGKKGAALGQTP